MDKDLLLNLSLLAGVLFFLIVLKLMRKETKTNNGYADLYEKVINSDEYKVKGQYDQH